MEQIDVLLLVYWDFHWTHFLSSVSGGEEGENALHFLFTGSKLASSMGLSSACIVCGCSFHTPFGFNS
jgi:hypothetical protein